MITPLIKQIDKNSLITFPSSLEDFNSYGRSTDNRKVFHSHFALLNLPDIYVPVTTENTLDFERLESVFVNGKNVGVNNIGDRLDLSESLQNFALNYEALLTEQEWYDKQDISNASERIFFKWLKEIGAIRYQYSNDQYVSGARYSEESESEQYSRLVQYISKIGVSGKITGKKNSFSEVYINIPSNVGRTPIVLFKTVSDINYYDRMVVGKGVDVESINGYNSISPTPLNGLSINALYNVDFGNVEYTSKNSDGVDVPNWSDYYTGLNAYLTDESFEDPSNDTVTMKYDGRTKKFLRSNLDGVQIDFDVNSYKSPEQVNIETLEDINSSFSSQSFEFNAILLYYTVIDQNTGESSINLYGVAFVGDIAQKSAGISEITRRKKIKSDVILGNVGNGYGYRFNFKMDSRQQDITPNIEIDEYETKTFSMGEFSATMLRMGEILARYEKSSEINSLLIEQNSSLMDYIRQMNLKDIRDEFTSIRKLIGENNINDINSGQIAGIYDKIDDIIRGKSDVSVSMATKFYGENGLSFTYSKEDDVMKIFNTITDYGESDYKNLSVVNGNVNMVDLKAMKKIVVFSTDMQINATTNILINDSISWKKGMSVNISFDKNIIGTSSVKVYTDKDAKVTSTEYGLLIIDHMVVGGDGFIITCMDSDSMKFAIQKTNML